MRPGLLMKVEGGMVRRSPSSLRAVMTGLVRLSPVGVGSLEKPGQDGAGYDGVDTNTEPRR